MFYEGLKLDEEWEVRGMTVREQKTFLSVN